MSTDTPVIASIETKAGASSRLVEFYITEPFEVHVSISSTMILVIVAILVIALLISFLRHKSVSPEFELDRAEIGLGPNKLILSPNETDRQIAYKIWVELSTRKIGLKIDLDHDVIDEIYDSWHTFFTITRELIKDVPVHKYKRSGTQAIVKLSIDVLNEGIRPHLTTWQAKFRRWYERECRDAVSEKLSPQEIQSNFPQFKLLKEDMLIVNERLMKYRESMHRLVTGEKQPISKEVKNGTVA